MNAEEPTDILALKLWWALVWRSVPISLISGAILGGFIGAIVAATGGSPESVQLPAGIAGFLVGIFIAVKVIRHLMTKGFGEYRLSIVKKS